MVKNSSSISIVLILAFWNFMSTTNPGTVILLNGTSSSGKSAIDPWLFLHDYFTEQTGKYYFDAPYDFYTLAKEVALKGEQVIIDTVLESEAGYNAFCAFFKDVKTIKLLVYCPLDVLLERVEQRNKLGIPEEMRHAFLSFEQFPAIYKIQENSNDQAVDVAKSDVTKKALEAVIQELLDMGIPEVYVPKLKKFKQNFIKQFKLDDQKEVILAAKQHYDSILSTKSNSPYDLAKTIACLIEQKH